MKWFCFLYNRWQRIVVSYWSPPLCYCNWNITIVDILKWSHEVQPSHPSVPVTVMFGWLYSIVIKWIWNTKFKRYLPVVPDLISISESERNSLRFCVTHHMWVILISPIPAWNWTFSLKLAAAIKILHVCHSEQRDHQRIDNSYKNLHCFFMFHTRQILNKLSYSAI